MTEFLMNEGISTQGVDENGNTPIHTAAEFGELDLIPIVLENCSNINACNNQGNTILHNLCSRAFRQSELALIEECVQSVLAKDADVNLQNKMGWTSVHLAAKSSYLGVLKMFLCGGANLNLLTNKGESPLLVSCKYGGNEPDVLLKICQFNLHEHVELLVNKGCNVNQRDREGYSSLHYTCRDDEVAASKKLIEAGADIQCRTQDFLLTPLHCAAYRSAVLFLKTLVEAGANVNAKTIDGATPLHLVGLSGPLDSAKYLIENGVDISCRESIFGFTVLHMAALGGNEMNLQYFLEQGLDVNDGGHFGITPFHLASFRGNLECAKMLLAHGADAHCRGNRTHSTALHFAAAEGEILDYIGPMCDVKLKTCWANEVFFTRSTEIVVLLAQNGVGVNDKDVYGRTPLHLATMYGGRQKCRDALEEFWADTVEDIHAIVGLLSCGAYTDMQDNEGNLPVHNALRTGHKTALKRLLEFGVDVNEADTSRLVLSCEKRMQNVVFKFLVKLRAAGLPVSNAYGMYADAEFQSLYNECLNEVENMKFFFIDDMTFIYDILHFGWRQRSNFAQELPVDLKEKFPLYAGIIEASCNEALQRKSLLEPAKLGWYRITEVNLPDICVERILAHLKNRYLRVLAEGLSEDTS